jgi:hypothetical protein
MYRRGWIEALYRVFRVELTTLRSIVSIINKRRSCSFGAYFVKEIFAGGWNLTRTCCHFHKRGCPTRRGFRRVGTTDLKAPVFFVTTNTPNAATDGHVGKPGQTVIGERPVCPLYFPIFPPIFPPTKSNSTCSIAAHPCEKRKDGAPSVGTVHVKIVKGGHTSRSKFQPMLWYWSIRSSNSLALALLPILLRIVTRPNIERTTRWPAQTDRKKPRA